MEYHSIHIAFVSCCWILVLLGSSFSKEHAADILNLQPTGREITFRGLYLRVAGHRLSAIVSQMISNSSVEDCATKCVLETMYQCKSFDFDNKQQACLLFSVSVNDEDVHLISSAGRDHYQTSYTTLFNRLPNHMLTTTHNQQIPSITVEECARRCVLETLFKCRGFDYELEPRTCWLTELRPDNAMGINVLQGYDYYERNPEGPLDRFVNYGFGHMRPLAGSTIYEKQYRGVTLENCATMCLADKDFHCLSFDYNFIVGDQQSTCHLSQYIAANVRGMAASPTKRTLHFERKEQYLSYFYATPYAVVLGNNHKTFSSVTPNRCARYCLEEEAFVCRSFDYKIADATCILSSKTGSDVGGLFNQGLQEVHHFEMKPLLDCGGTLTAAEGGIASPNWPRNYAHHENCVWKFIVHQYKVIKFKFSHIDLGMSQRDRCNENEDRVMISWLDNWTGEAKATCVLPDTKVIHANANTAVLQFKTNSQVDGQGFRVFYSEEWPCDAFLSKAPGEFASPEYPENYPHSARCSWRITAPVGKRVRVHFTNFQLEMNPLNHCNDQFDHVIILDGGTVNAARIGLYCGSHEPFTVRSSGRDMFIQFKSDATTSRQGFHAAFEFESIRDPYSGPDVLDVDPDIEYYDNTITSEEEDEEGGKTAKSTGRKDGVAGDHHNSYKTAMWAVLTTLLLIVIIIAVVIFIFWRRRKLRSLVFWRREELQEEHIPEEMPLQGDNAAMKQNNVIDLTKPSPSKRSFSNMLYEEPCTQQNNLNWKTVNLDTKT